MTDLEKFIELYKGFGIELKVEETHEGKEIWLNYTSNSEKFDGYMCFYSDVRFTKEGAFVSQGFWE